MTQQVVRREARGEHLDALDRRWALALESAGRLCVPLPSSRAIASQLVARAHAPLIVFSGGNDLVGYGDNTAPERDATEAELLARAQRDGIPLLGVCRGAQFIAAALGARLRRVADHAATRHVIRGVSRRIELSPLEVNSYHHWAIDDATLPRELHAIARSEDGAIEAYVHEELPIAGIMWHPEREGDPRAIAHALDLVGQLCAR